MNPILESSKFIVAREFLSEKDALWIGEDFRNFCTKNKIKSNDKYVPNSQSVAAYYTFIEQLCLNVNKVTHIVEEIVFPTYAYGRNYLNGSYLTPHVDRDSCEISISINLGGDENWNIWVKPSEETKVGIELNPGDAIVYLGNQIPHYRDKFQGTYYTQMFLHYVRSRGPYSNHYFDNIVRKDVTKPKRSKKIDPLSYDIKGIS
jgi:hypothetical protein